MIVHRIRRAAGLCLLLACTVAPTQLLAAIQKRAAASAKLSAADVFERYSGAVAVVEVFAGTEDRNPSGLGSGLLFVSLLITNAHVVQNASRIQVRLPSKTFSTSEIDVFYVDVEGDLAVISLHNQGAIGPELHVNRAPKVGSKVFAIGNPRGLERTVSEGIVSGLRRFESLGTVIQHTAPISPGSSGGVLFDETGGILGLTVGHLEGGQNLNFALPWAAVEAAIRQAIDPPSDNPESWPAFAERVRKRFPGTYDRTTDLELLRILRSKYPDLVYLRCLIDHQGPLLNMQQAACR